MAGKGGASAELEAFFSALPTAHFTPHETALRQALLDFIQARAPKPFPLVEWVDRRIGGEIEVRRNEAGQDELFIRGAAQPPGPPPAAGGGGARGTATPPVESRVERVDRDTFFASLDPNSFSQEEDAMRDAVFEFLARWKSRELATLTDLNNDAGVRRCMAAFLPPDVQLKDWIEQRIGGEVEFKADARGQEIVHLTATARPFVTAKYEEIAASSGKGQGPRQQPSQMPPPPNSPVQQPNAPSRDAFFQSLPANELTQDELALRGALLQFIDSWPRISVQLGKSAGVCPLLSDLVQDPGAQKSRAALLPPNISLKEWIDRRVGGEIELRKAEKGQFEVRLRGSGGSAKGRRGPSPAKARGGAREELGERKINSIESAEEFISKLPLDRHTDAEVDLRQAILDYLEGRDAPVQLSDVCKHGRIIQCRSALLPPEVPLRVWIDRRIGGEVETAKDTLGRYILQMRNNNNSTPQDENSEQKDSYGDNFKNDQRQTTLRGEGSQTLVEAVGTDAHKEQFFAGLPADGFTPDEEGLREALLDILGTWKDKEPPTLAHAGFDARVKKFRVKVIPKGSPVTLRDWIDRRIGGEVEMFDGPMGQLHFGLRGHKGFASGPKKRGAGAGGESGRPWKKGGSDGRGGGDRSGGWN